MAKLSGLGCGLDALFDDNSANFQTVKQLRISEIEPNKSQPRKSFSEESIAALAESIQKHGVIQPILVRTLPNGAYQIVAGERRWRAARMVGLDEIPAVIRDLNDSETMQIALIENLQRENLNPIEEALGYRELMDAFNMKQDEVAATVGRSRSAVANAVRLLKLPPDVRKLLENGDISVGHAKALLMVNDDKILHDLAVKAASGKLTVRALEELIAKILYGDNPKDMKYPPVDSYFQEMELSLNENLGRKVRVDYSAVKNKGVLVLEFYDKDDLAAIADKLV